eukprot:GFUD01015753.1.p1 GENE.GFUD01015753.1~~GFUD01015753.1.p1  ORF type:complete len:889 (+),score=228.79 GFUD01015753.1:240-2906(+)
MVRRSSRSRSRGRPDVYQAGEVKSPPKKKQTGPKTPKVEEKKMIFEAGDSVMGRWPGSKLYYNAKVQLLRPDEDEYDLEFENGIVFTVAAKDVYKPSSGALRKAVTSRKSKSRARSTGRGKRASQVLITQDSEEESFNASKNKSVGFEEPLEKLITESFEEKELKVPRSTARGSASSKVSKKASSSSRVSKKESNSSKTPLNFLASDLTEDEDYLVEPTKASNSSRKSKTVSNSSRKSTKLESVSSEEEEPPLILPSRRSNSSRITDNGDIEPLVGLNLNRISGSSRISNVPVTDIYSDEEELLSVSARPSISSKVSKKLSISSRISNLISGSTDDGGSNKPSNSSIISKKMSFSSKISKMVGGVTTDEETVNVEIEQPSENSEITKKISVSSQKSGRTSKSSIKNENIEFSDDAEIDEDADTMDAVSPRRSSRISNKASDSTNISKKLSSSSNVTNNSVRLDEYSEDESYETKESPSNNLTDVKKTGSWSFEWVWAILFMLLCPTILITLHTICTGNVCNLSMPRISTNPVDYFDQEAMMIVIGFATVLRACEFFCLGTDVAGYRMNGFQTLLLSLLAVPVLVSHKVSMNLVFLKYFHLMSSCIILSFLQSLISYILSRWASSDNLSSKGSTGNPIVDLYHGRELNPTFLGCNMKLQTFRFSMICLALLNVTMVTDSVVSNGGKINPAVVIAATLQVLYSMDAMFFEEYYFYSHDYLNSGYGWSLISSYLTFPFLPTLITRYMIYRSPEVEWYYLALIGFLNMLGYLIYRSSENQRCELAKDPNNPKLSHLQTCETAQNRKLIVSGWWSLVRHPNYLGELLIQWSWVLPAVSTLGLTDLVPYYLPVVTTLMLVIRCVQINRRNKRKYGNAWNEYCGKVKANIVPLVF